ncbi:MAG: hypothetical protein HQL64_16315 [Magnetococcales bacterium]|nr:hypothetical protein [Magnetococcales bacterium]
MTAKASLKLIAEEIETLFDEDTAYFDRETGEVFVVSEAMRGAAEHCQPDGFPEWQLALIEIASAVADDHDGRYLALPNKYDFHEYAVMERFCHSRDNDAQEEDLLEAIRGRGAFRRFKDRLYQLGIQDDWYRFRGDALRELAAEWAEENGIELAEE